MVLIAVPLLIVKFFAFPVTVLEVLAPTAIMPLALVRFLVPLPPRVISLFRVIAPVPVVISPAFQASGLLIVKAALVLAAALKL